MKVDSQKREQDMMKAESTAEMTKLRAGLTSQGEIARVELFRVHERLLQLRDNIGARLAVGRTVDEELFEADVLTAKASEFETNSDTTHAGEHELDKLKRFRDMVTQVADQDIRSLDLVYNSVLEVIMAKEQKVQAERTVASNLEQKLEEKVVALSERADRVGELQLHVERLKRVR